MAKRRMFSLDVVGSDAFLDMPVSSQVLYFHLAMRADDDGFVGNPKVICRMVGANDDDFKVLAAKRFVLVFDSGVVVVKHWLNHNLIRPDLYKQTQYVKEKSTLGLNENGAYTELRKGVALIKQIDEPLWLKKRKGTISTDDGTQTVRKRYANGTIGKVRLGKVSNTIPNGIVEMQSIYDHYIKTFNKNPNSYKLTDKRKLKIKLRLKDAGKDMLIRAINNVANSPFHMGDNDRGWTADLDYIIRSYEQVEKFGSEYGRVKTIKADW